MIEKVVLCPARYECWCDAPGCDARIGYTESPEDARTTALAAGWRGDGTGKCFCPAHLPKEGARA